MLAARWTLDEARLPASNGLHNEVCPARPAAREAGQEPWLPPQSARHTGTVSISFLWKCQTSVCGFHPAYSTILASPIF